MRRRNYLRCFLFFYVVIRLSQNKKKQMFVSGKETNVRILSSSCQQIISSFAAGLGHEDFRASESD